MNNREKKLVEVEPGTHSLSNHFLNTPWPKVRRGKANLRNYIINVDEVNEESLFEMAMDRKIAEDHDLPSTGVPLDLERQLSPLFIKTEGYGTRSITVLTISKNKEVNFVERTFKDGEFTSEERFNFTI